MISMALIGTEGQDVIAGGGVVRLAGKGEFLRLAESRRMRAYPEF